MLEYKKCPKCNDDWRYVEDDPLYIKIISWGMALALGIAIGKLIVIGIANI